MNIKIRRVKMENFKNFDNAEFSFPNDLHIVQGRNASGKSTIVDAVCWCLFDKLADGTTANKIRPVDALGNVKHYVDIKAEIALEVDGVEMVICKVQSEKWTKKRGSEDAEYGGNQNAYEVNGVPMTEKAFKAKIAEIINEDVFRFASVLGAFTNLDQKKRREMLLKLADAEAVDNLLKEEYPDLYAQYLEKYSVEEVNAMIGKALKENKKELETIPIRIDELSKQRVAGDINSLLSEAADIRAKIAKDENEPIKTRILALESAKRQLIYDVETENADRKHKARKELDKARDVVSELESEIRTLKRKIEKEFADKELLEDSIAKARESYAFTKKMKSDDVEDTCRFCGQKLPLEVVDKAKAEMEKKIKENLKGIKETADNQKKLLLKVEENILTLQSSINAHELLLDDANKALNHAKEELNKIVDKTVDTSEIDDAIAKYNSMMKESDDHIDELKRLKGIELQIARINGNESIDNRIKALNERRVELSQSIADSEKVKFQLEDFTRRRTNLLTEEVNSYFKFVEWVLFEEQINGGLKEVCNATVDGCVVGNGLNTGHTILAYIDICTAMQKVYGYNIFMFIDNAESLSEETVERVHSSVESQYIFLLVADKDLEVKK